MQRVHVAGGEGELAHVTRGADGRAVHEAARLRRVRRVACQRVPACRLVPAGGRPTASGQYEDLLEARQLAMPAGCSCAHRHRDGHPARCRVRLHRADPRGGGHVVRVVIERAQVAVGDVDAVLRVQQVWEIDDEVLAIREHRVDGGPGEADEGIDTRGRTRYGQRVGGNALRAHRGRPLGDPIGAPYFRQHSPGGAAGPLAHRAQGRLTAHPRWARGGQRGIDVDGDRHGRAVELPCRPRGGKVQRGGCARLGICAVCGVDDGRGPRVHGVDARAASPLKHRGAAHDIAGALPFAARVLAAVGSLLHAREPRRRGVLEPPQNIGHRLVHAGHPAHRDRARDGAHRVGAVPRVVGLPQGIAAPPGVDVSIDNRHEPRRLPGAVAAAHELNEPVPIGRVHGAFRGRRVGLHQRGDGPLRVPRRIHSPSHAQREFAVVAVGQARLGAGKHRDKARRPALIDPGVQDALAHVAVARTEKRQLHVAAQPPRVRHVRNVAEVRLRGLRQRGDDLVAGAVNRVRVPVRRAPGDPPEQPAGPTPGVVQFVEVRAELRTPSRHPAGRGARRDPLAGARRVHQRLFHRRRGGRFPGGEGGGADEHAIDRRGRQVEIFCPRAGEELGGALRCSDAPAHHEQHVVAGADGAVRLSKRVFQPLPRVVAAGLAALQLEDEGLVGQGIGKREHRLHVAGGPRLERHPRDRGGLKPANQLDGLLARRDPRGDHHAINRRARPPLVNDAARAGDLLAPPLRVEVQRVELRIHAVIELVVQGRQRALQLGQRVLPAAG